MMIRWHGHACFEIKNNLRIVIDPHDGRSIGLKPPKVTADLVLVTHNHFDHNAVRVVNGKFKTITGPGKYRTGDIKINGIEAYHDEYHGAKRGKIAMYKIIMDGISLLHAGDLGHILNSSQLKEIGDVDILFIPVGGVYTVDARGAYENVKLINPKIAVPMHYYVPGLSLRLNPVDDFLRYFSKDEIVYVGNSIEFSKDDLESQARVWVFTL